MRSKEEQAREERELTKRLRNATTEICPECGCKNVERFGSLLHPDDDIHCECKNKQCQFTWGVSPDPTMVFSTQRDKGSYFFVRKDLGYAVWVFKNRREHNRIRELNSAVIYYGKLLSRYGYNSEADEWNLKKFPTTQTDSQMEGIKNDIDAYDKAAANLEEYRQYLAEKYDMDLGQMRKYTPCIYLLEDKYRRLSELDYD